MAACSYKDLIYFGGGKNMNWTKISDFYCFEVQNKNIQKKVIKHQLLISHFTSERIYLAIFFSLKLGQYDHSSNDTSN